MKQKYGQLAQQIVLLMMACLLLAGCAVQVPAAAPAASQDAAASEASADESAVATVVVTHPQGETTVAQNPENIIVFDYSALDTLDQLGIDSIVGVPQGNAIPALLAKYQADPYVNVGTLFEPDYEKVNELKPGLIIVGGRSAAVYPELSEIAPTVDVSTNNEDLLDSMKASWTNLGIIFDKEAEVAAKIAEIDAAIAEVQAKATERGGTALIVMVSGGEISAYGPGSRFGVIHDLFGVAPVVENIEEATHGDAISFEFILEYDPDILFVIDRDSALNTEGALAAVEVLDNELMHQTKAWQNDDIIYLDGAIWYLANAGIGTFATMVDEISTGLD